MKKTTCLCLGAIGICISCTNTNQGNTTSTNTNNNPLPVIVESTKTNENISQSDIADFSALYSELLTFISQEDFKKMGFGTGSPYNNWLERAKNFSSTANMQHFVPLGFVPEDVVSLAYIYVTTKGTDNNASKILKNAIENGLAKASGNNENKEIVLPETDTESIIGHWKTSGGLNYDIKIIKRNNQYFSIENNKVVELTLKGDKYFLENSKTGEYYKIVNGKIRFYDKDGDFTDLFKINVVILVYVTF